MTTLGQLYQATRKAFADAGLSTPDLDARLLISYALGHAPQDVILKPETPTTSNAALDDAIARRLQNEPVAKITGTREFYGLTFKVNRHVLDPRPDTETLIDAARRYMKPGANVLDLCTGSGCILATLLTLYPDATGVAADISADALAVARDNFSMHAITNRVATVQGPWLENVTGRYTVIACNPPYIETDAIAGLDADVRLYDPVLALDGGPDGLAPYRIVFPQIRNYLSEDGVALFEFGAGQGDDIARLAATSGLQVIDRLRDLAGHERVVVLR